jgi:hypothetical protein
MCYYLNVQFQGQRVNEINVVVFIIEYKINKSNPCTYLDRPWGLQGFEAPILSRHRHMKVLRFSALGTG